MPTWLQVNIQQFRNCLCNWPIVKSNCGSSFDDRATIYIYRLIVKPLKVLVLVFLEINVPRRPIPASGDHVSSADDTRKICSPDSRRKCDLGSSVGPKYVRKTIFFIFFLSYELDV